MNPVLSILTILLLLSCGRNDGASSQSRNHESFNQGTQMSQDAIALNNEAVEYLQIDQASNEQIDSAIYLLDRATELERDYLIAYSNKIIFLNRKKDFTRLLETNKEIQRIQPEVPLWIMQEGLIHELLGDTLVSNQLYEKGLSTYDSIIQNTKDIGFDLKLEFIGSLVIGNKPERAKEKLAELNREYPSNEIIDAFELESKEVLMEKITGSRFPS